MANALYSRDPRWDVAPHVVDDWCASVRDTHGPPAEAAPPSAPDVRCQPVQVAHARGPNLG